jgi:nitrogen fixation NifU-like protein
MIPVGNRSAIPFCTANNSAIQLEGNPGFSNSKELQQFPHIGNWRNFPHFSIDFKRYSIHGFLIIRIALKPNQGFPNLSIRKLSVNFHGWTRPFEYSSLTLAEETKMNEKNISLIDRLSQIYSPTTVEHVLRPRNIEIFANPDGYAACSSGCGESMKIYLKVRDDVVENTAFWTNGCAATIACGSMGTELAKNKLVLQALAIDAQNIADALADFPEGNFHCAELAAYTLRMALKDCISIQQQPWKKLYRK